MRSCLPGVGEEVGHDPGAQANAAGAGRFEPASMVASVRVVREARAAMRCTAAIFGASIGDSATVAETGGPDGGSVSSRTGGRS